jgi:transketolase
MRREFVNALVNEGKQDERIVLLTGDLGFAALEPFAEAFPDRFFNAGAAEQNMVGMATGLAEAGFTPYVYSISTFATMRPYEFIRNGPVLHGLPVRVVGTGEGVDYGHNGMTHYALEDVAIMRAQPGMAVVTPGASGQLAAVVHAVQALPGPAYLRVSKQTIEIPALDGVFEFGRADQLADGDDVAIIAMGGMVEPALEASQLLVNRGISASVTAISSIAPAPEDDLVALLSSTPVALTVESHYVTGGLGSLVAETIAEHNIDCRLIRAGVRELPLGISGGREFMHDQLGLSAERLAETATNALTAGQSER